MSNQWLDALSTAGMNELAIQLREAPADTVSGEADSRSLRVDLSASRVVDVTGEEAAGFLQGQFSNDLSKVSATRAQITGYCTPKGRLLALPLIMAIDSGFRLVLPASVKEGFVKRLSMFVMRAKVTIREREELICSGVIADDTGSTGAMADGLGALPAGVMDVANGPDGQIVRWHDMPGSGSGSGSSARARYLVIADSERQVDLWQQGNDLPARTDALWRLADIRAGVPTIGKETLEAFVPQMLNLQLIDGLSFTKGCYPGQEIVARMQYLGKLKRHMRYFMSDKALDMSDSDTEAGSAIIPPPGSRLQTETDADAGVVVDAVLASSGHLEILAVVKVSTDGQTLLSDTVPLAAAELPYPLPTLEQPLGAG